MYKYFLVIITFLLLNACARMDSIPSRIPSCLANASSCAITFAQLPFDGESPHKGERYRTRILIGPNRGTGLHAQAEALINGEWWPLKMIRGQCCVVFRRDNFRPIEAWTIYSNPKSFE